MSQREIYYQLVKRQAELFDEKYETYVNECKANMGEKGCCCDDLAAYAYLEYALYCFDKNRDHLKNAKQALNDMGELSDLCYAGSSQKSLEGTSYTIRQAVLKSGRLHEAPMEAMFIPTYFLLTYQGLVNEQEMTPELKELCERSIFRSLKPLFEYTDWGPQNRGMIKGTNLTLAGICFPDSKQAEECRKLGKILCEESLGKWSIEDAQVYIPIWLNEVIIYQNVCGSDTYYQNPLVKYYFDYMVSLTAPSGMVPEFGDGRFLNSAEAYICCLEKGADIYKDGKMKKTAAKIMSYMLNQLKQYESTMNNICFLANALIWCNEVVKPEKVPFKSSEILDDLIGKKYRFYNKNGDNEQYLFVNYRDEGPYARRVRNYMRSTLVVEDEKMHHGHSDENSIVLLTAGDSVLLRDGGYREMDGEKGVLPGGYRSDFYHNRLVVRNTVIDNVDEFLTYCSKEPTYKRVETDKIYFEVFQTCDTARTKVVDPVHHIESDRCIVYDKRNGYYLILDFVQALEDGDYTFAPIYYGESVTKSDREAVLKNFEIVCDQPFEKHFANSQEYALKILFPQKQFEIGSEEIRRSYHQETGVYSIFRGNLKKGERVGMVSVLCPVKEQEMDAKKMEVKQILDMEDGIGVEIEAAGEKQIFAFRYDLNKGHRRGIKKPEYAFDRKAIHYGELYTDALFTHMIEAEDKVNYEVLSFTRVEYKEQLLMQVKQSSLIQGNWTLEEGVSEWNKWYDEVKKESI